MTETRARICFVGLALISLISAWMIPVTEQTEGYVAAMVVTVVFTWIGIPGVISGIYFYKKYRGM